MSYDDPRQLEYEVVSKAIKEDIEPAYNHTTNHVTVQSEILKLDSDCEYCKIYFDEEKIIRPHSLTMHVYL